MYQYNYSYQLRREWSFATHRFFLSFFSHLLFGQMNNHNLSSTSLDNLPSPAYRQFPSSSNLRLEEESPAYIMDQHFPLDVNKTLDKARHIPEKDVDRPDERDVAGDDDANNGQTIRVHYPQDLPSLPSPVYLPKKASGKTDTDSRASSVIGTDDEDDDGRDEDDEYDWSGEEDLVDEEAKFEKQIKSDHRAKRWGPKR